MHKAIKEILSIQNENGRLRKQKIISQNKNNEYFRKLLYYALNPNMTYKVSEQTLLKSRDICLSESPAMSDIFSVCEFLAQRKALDEETLGRLYAFLQLQDDSAKEFYIKLFSKTLRLGITAKTVNKIIPNLIPEWEVQQAYPIEKYPIKDGDKFAITQKLNGVRATYYKGKLIARSGIPFLGLDHIINRICLCDTNDMVFDGELILKDSRNYTDNEAFRIATGIINSDDEDKSAICFTIFDAIPTEEFDVGVSQKSYFERRTLYLSSLQNATEQVKEGDAQCVRVLPVLCKTDEQKRIFEFLDIMEKEDKEGVVVNLDVPYKRCRHRGILKVKKFYTMDLPIIRCEEGTGRLLNTLGAFVVDYKGNEVKVGSGFTDEQRRIFWKIKEEVVGALCEVKYKEISYDKHTQAESLQFPVFVALRTDKEQINYE